MSALEVTPLPEPFDINHVIDDVLANTDVADPSALAGIVLCRLNEIELRTAARQMLRGYLRERLTRLRLPPGLAPVRPVDDDTRPPKQKSWKRDMIQAKAEQIRRARVQVGRDDDGRERWMLFGDCTRDDLNVLARSRRALAEAVLAKAETYERLADVLEKQRAGRVRELPAESLLAAMRGAA
jgi:hypothetical protein